MNGIHSREKQCKNHQKIKIKSFTLLGITTTKDARNTSYNYNKRSQGKN